MSEFAGFDLDRSTARAWSAFQSRLADRVAEMQDDDIVSVVAESAVDEHEGAAPYVQFCGWGEELVRCEVSSNEYLADEHHLDQAGVDALVDLGWSAPTHGSGAEPDAGSSNFFVDLERNHADKLAVMTVRAFRDVFGVEHPAFLASSDLVDEAGDRGEASDGVSSETPEELAVVPASPEHLRELIDAALVPVFGSVPAHDEDDDVPVVAGSGLIWVRVLDDMPVVQLFAVLVSGVEDNERAVFEVGVLNRDVPLVKFVLAGDSVMAHVHLPAYPFAPMQLRATLSMLSDVVDLVDDDLAARVGGRRALEAAAAEDVDETDEPLHPAMLTLLQLDVETPGSVDPQLAASICEMDRDLVLELITRNSSQEIAWRHARDEALLLGDPDEAGVCEHEMQHAEQLTNLLRRALRVIVETHASAGHGYAAPNDVRRRGRAAPDRALPGLDADEQGLWEE